MQSLTLFDEKCILIVDDEYVNRKTLRGMLKKIRNARIIEAGTGREALQKAEADPPDLILMDIMMPEMDGIEACKKIQQIHAAQHTPVIFLSALDDTQFKAKGFAVGGVDYVSKPFDAHELLSRVQAHLALKEHADMLQGRSRRLEAAVRTRTQQLEESERLYRAIFETTQNATYIVEESGYIGLVNSAFSSLSGLDREDIEGVKLWKDFVHAQDRDRVAEYRRLRLQGQNAPSSYEFRFVNKEGETTHVLSTAGRISGTQRTVVSLLDITEQKRFEAELEHRALYDTLTGLPNRSLFRSIVGRILQSKNHSTFAVLFLDLDRFRLLNESLGHQWGDVLLKQAAGRLQAAVGDNGTVSRFSSDKFLILLEQTQDSSEVVVQAERIRDTFKEPFLLNEREVYSTCCIGIAMSSRKACYMCAEDAIRDAEMAMHRAKGRGQNAIKAFHPWMHEQTVKFMETERDLHQAIKMGEFIVYYQPIVELPELHLKGFEALIRWKHPQKGLVSPAEFIPIAEETELIVPVGKMVLQMACAQMSQWQRSFRLPELFVSINLSAKQFKQPDLVYTVRDVLTHSELQPECLKLEITESTIMSDVQSSNAVLAELRNMGVQLAVDDFGTGYSSLSYLQSFPLDYIKIDKSFVWGVETNEQNAELIKAVVAMGHSMDHKVIAEGVETQDHVTMLRSIGCDLGQGFYFATPMSACEAGAYLQKTVHAANSADSDSGLEYAGSEQS